MTQIHEKKSFFIDLFRWILPITNRRQFKRVRVPFLLRYTVLDSGLGSITNLHDLSVGGVLFTSEHPLLRGSVLKLELNLPTSQKPVQVSAEVLRVTKVLKSNIYRVATRFSNLNASDRKAIRMLIERMSRDRRVKGLVNRKKRVWARS